MINRKWYVQLAFIFILIVGTAACNSNPIAAQKTSAGKTIEKKSADSPTHIKADVKFGKYGCTASHYSNGSVEYQSRGFLTLDESGKYTYAGFKNPSEGTYTVDEKGNLHFKGGYLDGGEATKIDRPNKYFLVFPANPDNRWTCGWVE
jgi:hypothetical protein